MLIPVYTNQFEKDIKKITKSGHYDIQKIKDIIQKLINQVKLEPKYKDHILINNYKGYRECHIEPDWLLIYKVKEQNIIFERTGTHSELFS